ncbi:MAG: thiamine phosphate synthase [Bauldia sp.]|uniref:thiamine phosphate synthase n=1 Tax=Bauldia sp. TaxID=2575872 RepID=UPI001D71AC80|nr:thiamine phosphate synthase [Bauldia sp.]MCB1495714.1 thiamine phosphate synthase [Bauldia sp.]
MRRLPDLTLMLVTDAGMMARRGVIDTVMAAVAGGVTAVQLRDKTASDEAMIRLARDLRRRLAPQGIPLFVNDRTAVAIAAEADGLHIGQGDGDPRAARARIGETMLLGLSVTGEADIATVDPAIVDYVGLGPIFASATKADATPALGLEATRAVGARLPLPWVAIGGIDAGNAPAIMATGAAGLAVVSAIAAADDPEQAASALKSAMAGAYAA